jgi:hypothetical protein
VSSFLDSRESRGGQARYPGQRRVERLQRDMHRRGRSVGTFQLKIGDFRSPEIMLRHRHLLRRSATVVPPGRTATDRGIGTTSPLASTVLHGMHLEMYSC